MAYLSEILTEEPGIPLKFKEQVSLCCMCGKKISSGGMWATQEAHLGICKDCAPSLLDWYIDTLLDSDIINENDDIENIKNLSNSIIDRYKRKKQKKEKYKKNHM